MRGNREIREVDGLGKTAAAAAAVAARSSTLASETDENQIKVKTMGIGHWH